jgi:hypothetical protein
VKPKERARQMRKITHPTIVDDLPNLINARRYFDTAIAKAQAFAAAKPSGERAELTDDYLMNMLVKQDLKLSNAEMGRLGKLLQQASEKVNEWSTFVAGYASGAKEALRGDLDRSLIDD